MLTGILVMRLVTSNNGSPEWEENGAASWGSDTHVDDLEDPQGRYIQSQVGGTPGVPLMQITDLRLPSSNYFNRLGNNTGVRIDPANFSMWIGQDAEGSLALEKHHIFCEFRDTAPRTSLPLYTLKDVPNRFPYAHSLAQGGIVECPIIHFQCSLAMTDSMPVERSTLCTQLSISVQGMPTDLQWECTTTVHIGDRCCSNIKHSIKPEAATLGIQVIPLPFASAFWARFFAGRRCELGIPGQRPKLEPGYASEGSPYGSDVANITITQAIFASPINSVGPPCLVGLFLWEFSECESTVPGSVDWRRISVSSQPNSNLTQTPAMSGIPNQMPYWQQLPSPGPSFTLSAPASTILYNRSSDPALYEGIFPQRSQPEDHPHMVGHLAPVNYFDPTPTSYSTSVEGGHGEPSMSHWNSGYNSENCGVGDT